MTWVYRTLTPLPNVPGCLFLPGNHKSQMNNKEISGSSPSQMFTFALGLQRRASGCLQGCCIRVLLMSNSNLVLEIGIFSGVLLPLPLHLSCQSKTRANETGPQGQPGWLQGCVNSGRTLSELILSVCCGLIHPWPSNLRIWLSPEGQMSELGVRAIFLVHWPAPVGW